MTDGNLPLEGRTVWMVRAARTPVVVGERLGEGGHGIVPAVQIGGASCTVMVPSKRRLSVHTIDFGSVKGRISVD